MQIFCLFLDTSPQKSWRGTRLFIRARGDKKNKNKLPGGSVKPTMNGVEKGIGGWVSVGQFGIVMSQDKKRTEKKPLT